MSDIFTNPPAPPKLSERLRTRTRPAHEAVEAALSRSLNPMTLDSYASLLARWHKIHRHLEPAIAAQLPPDLTPFIQSRSRMHLLEEDLSGLDRKTPDARPLRREELPINSPADALGVLYVLEGSTLGGQILCKRFAEALSLTPERGLRYFNSYGSQTALRWRETKQVLDDPRWNALDDAIIEAANRTFEALTRYFSAP